MTSGSLMKCAHARLLSGPLSTCHLKAWHDRKYSNTSANRSGFIILQYVITGALLVADCHFILGAVSNLQARAI